MINKEIENGKKVLNILSEIEDIAYEQKREDIFIVTEPETGLDIIVDAEETTICLIMEIADLPEDTASTEFTVLMYNLLVANDKSVHGAFCIDKNTRKILLKENLEAENLDANELESAMAMMFVTATHNIEKVDALTASDTQRQKDKEYASKLLATGGTN